MVATQYGFLSTSFSVMLVQSLPPFLVIHRKPSSVPAQRTSGLRGDSASAVALPCLVRVISGEMISAIVALLDRLEHVVAAAVEDVRVRRGKDVRRVPVEAITRRALSPTCAAATTAPRRRGRQRQPLAASRAGLIEARSPVRRL